MAAPYRCSHLEQKSSPVEGVSEVIRCFRQSGSRRTGLETREGVIEPTDINGRESRQRLTAHQIIEEANINANVCAARFIEGAQQYLYQPQF